MKWKLSTFKNRNGKVIKNNNIMAIINTFRKNRRTKEKPKNIYIKTKRKNEMRIDVKL